MAPNKRGGPQRGTDSSVLSAEEIAARGCGTDEGEGTDSYDGSLAAEVRVFFTGLMFLTRLPVPAGTDHHPTYLMRSTMYFPLIGAVVGLWGAVFYEAGTVLWSPAVAAGASLLATVWLTGCFHEDGMADCIDGFGGGWGKAQILRIMRDSRVGTYALVGMAVLLQIKGAAVAALPGPATAMIVAHCVCRWPSLPLLHWCTYLEDDEHAKSGMYNWMARSQRLITIPRMLFGTACALAVPAALLGAHGTLVVSATVLAVTAAAIYYSNAILGGVVGDYIGATIQATEIAVYLALGADWGAVARGGWRPLATLFGAVLVPVAWTRRIVDFC
ncbi:adenosylcobinamide-GDP ribazoletransferase [Raphidocelis subcapitata]|uniref:Adenosylcobinamide-GDP ribazoletransferase n=1 Tax=Raphidocelis subcapitata TaxID=307507 RepID=A0A2V0NMZ4_9CHLO|nr:adenosylcobinamide-GDP ribazoletransferase [Raphidocelis subcapitata]|eukprot:GBF88539.1 adenosylcobinamide-GDP ribazoletransferase [Raphidocelis subcapitata]